jgi:dual specificity tyrosine-phosphorylation-regulated kinase 1
VRVLDTYKTVNEVFYADLRSQNIRGKSVQNGGFDDENGNYIPVVGEEILDRYIVHAELGRGSFGVVVRCADRLKMQDVALKIIRNRTQFYNQAKLEVEILAALNQASTDDTCIVRVLKVFSWKFHPVIVFELLAFSLYDLVRQTQYNGVSLGLVRKFATQLLETLLFLRTQPQPVVHCDLKPENILLKNPKRSAIKVIDFGSACYESKRTFQYIQSRFYRSPEVMLRLPYGAAIDLWSLGCILVELHTGLPLFPGRSEVEQLHRITSILGPIPQAMIEPSRKQCHFHRGEDTSEEWVLASMHKGLYPDIARTTLADVLGVEKGGPGGRRADQPGHTPADYRVFLDFVSKLLQINPEKRPSPKELLQHEYIVSVPLTTVQPSTPATVETTAPPSISLSTSAHGAPPPPLAAPVPVIAAAPGTGAAAVPTTTTEDAAAPTTATQQTSPQKADKSPPKAPKPE